MLDTFIIEEIRRREEARRGDEDRPRPQLPVPGRESPAHPDTPENAEIEEKDPDRGVVIIDYSA